jgi:succinyl-diaminopimelate desuccinylase
MTITPQTTPLELAQRLIRIDSAGGNEAEVAASLTPFLEHHGFAVRVVALGPGRVSVVATYGGGGALVYSGHLDTVPFSADTWSSHPLDPVVDGGRLIGRGSSDMKGGVAALCLAAVRHVTRTPSARGFHLVLTAGEETGCDGARTIAASGLIPADPLLVIGESTANAVMLGHKGTTWLRAEARGVAAHGSRPDLGVSAIDDIVRAAVAVGGALPAAGGLSPLGSATTSIGTIEGGTQTNMVADRAALTVDVRTVPGVDAASVERAMADALRNGSVTRILDLPAVWTDEASGTAVEIARVVTAVTGRPQTPAGTAYFTDAAVLVPEVAPRAFIVGPGDPAQPHSADESCEIERLDEAVVVYEAILAAWEARRLD